MRSAPALLILGLLTGYTAKGQSNSLPEFDVASIRPSQQEGLLANHTPTLNAEPGRDIRFANIQLRDVIMLAYGIGIRQIVAPKWLYDPAGETNETPRFDIVAKVPANATQQQIPLMLQRLLAERFKLEFHREHRDMQVFALEIGKGGLKMQESAAEDRRETGCSRGYGKGPELTITAECHRMSVEDLAQQLQTLAPGYFRDGPIVDKTGLKGIYDLNLEWIRMQELNAGAGGPTMFVAVEKLGLKLEKRKEPVDMFVVDRCERQPTEN